jgi:hypothetical protein
MLLCRAWSHLIGAPLLVLLFPGFAPLMPFSVTAGGAAPRVVNQAIVTIPGVALLGLSPNGQRLLGERRSGDGPNLLCSYEVVTLAETACAGLQAAGYGEDLARASVAWSPDGEQIAFTEDTRSGREGDVWVFDLADGTLANMTDDGIEGDYFFGPVDPAATVDSWPTWSPDGRAIAFARAGAIREERAEVGLFRIDSATGKITQIAPLPNVAFGEFVEGVRWLGDGRVVYATWDPETDIRTIWVVDGTSEEPRPLASLDAALLDVSARGQALVWYRPASSSASPAPTYGLVDLTTGADAPLETPEALPGYPRNEALVAIAPDGATLLYVAGSGEAPPTRLAWVALDDGASGILVEGLDLWHDGRTSLGLTWATDGTLFVPSQPTAGQAGGTLLQLAGGDGTPAALIDHVYGSGNDGRRARIVVAEAKAPWALPERGR